MQDARDPYPLSLFNRRTPLFDTRNGAGEGGHAYGMSIAGKSGVFSSDSDWS
jgi:hypothetical protein